MGKQRQAGGVGPEYGNIGQAQEPEDQEGPVIAEDIPGNRVQAACVRIPGGQIVRIRLFIRTGP